MSVVHLHNGQLVIEQNGRYADQQGRRIRAAGMKHSWSEVFRFGDEDLTKIFNIGFFFIFQVLRLKMLIVKRYMCANKRERKSICSNSGELLLYLLPLAVTDTITFARQVLQC